MDADATKKEHLRSEFISLADKLHDINRLTDKEITVELGKKNVRCGKTYFSQLRNDPSKFPSVALVEAMRALEQQLNTESVAEPLKPSGQITIRAGTIQSGSDFEITSSFVGADDRQRVIDAAFTAFKTVKGSTLTEERPAEHEQLRPKSIGSADSSEAEVLKLVDAVLEKRRRDSEETQQ